MSSGLFGFIYNTLYKRVNNPSNTRFWLPRLLAGLKGDGGSQPLLPLKAKDWNLGDITAGESAKTLTDGFAAGWWSLVEKDNIRSGKPVVFKDYQAIACPNHPHPHLAMPDVTVNGLNNVAVLSNPAVTDPAEGYDAVIPIQFGAYDTAAGGMALDPLQIAGRYELRQCLCAALKSSPQTCTTQTATFKHISWPSQTITGTGNVVVNVVGAFVDAQISVRVAGSDGARSLRVDVDKLTVRGSTPGSLPTLAFDRDRFTIDSSLSEFLIGAWKDQVLSLFGSAQAQAAMIANLNDTLNQPGNRARIAELLTERMNHAVNDTLSSVPDGQLPSDGGQAVPNACNRYLFDRIRFSFTNPQSFLFLPSVIANFDSPALEPFQAGTISVGSVRIAELDVTFDNVQLDDVVVTGLSNISAPPANLLFTAVDLDAQLQVSSLSSPPVVTVKRDGGEVQQQVPLPPLTLTGTFSMNADGSDALSGGLAITVDRSTVDANVRASGPDADEIQIAIGNIRLSAPFPALHVGLKIDSAFREIIEQILNTDDVKRKVLDAINTKLNEAATLPSINAKATEGARRQVGLRLDA